MFSFNSLGQVELTRRDELCFNIIMPDEKLAEMENDMSDEDNYVLFPLFGLRVPKAVLLTAHWLVDHGAIVALHVDDQAVWHIEYEWQHKSWPAITIPETLPAPRWVWPPGSPIELVLMFLGGK
jgi:hypothetical protein